MGDPIEAVLVGAGNRGYEAYGPYALKHPERIRFTGVVDPHEGRRRRFAEAHGIAPERQFGSWQDLYARGRIAEALVNCTLDRMHLASTLPALELGYEVLLEKPMANTLEGNVQLVRAAEERGRLLMICHVLRYTACFSALHRILASGRLGRIITVEHRENVVYWHMAHSFVRGNWRDSQIESPMILAKCCHDMDLLFWNLGPVRRLNSFGSLLHYRPENAPPGAPERCTDGCPVADDCSWYAPRLYLRDDGYDGWPISVISEDAGLVARRRALGSGCTLGAQLLLVDDNQHTAVALAKLTREIGLDYLVIKPYSQHPASLTTRYASIDYSAYLPLQQELEAQAADGFDVVFRAETMRRAAAPAERYGVCSATPFFWAYVKSDGTVWQCWQGIPPWGPRVMGKTVSCQSPRAGRQATAV